MCNFYKIIMSNGYMYMCLILYKIMKKYVHDGFCYLKFMEVYFLIIIL